jgi:hypothetical protein
MDWAKSVSLVLLLALFIWAAVIVKASICAKAPVAPFWTGVRVALSC